MTHQHAARFEQAARTAEQLRRPLLLTHAKPDGDALGSLVAMRNIFREMGAEPVATLFAPVPPRYAPLWPDAEFNQWDAIHMNGALDRVDGVVVLDTCTYSQLAPADGWLRSFRGPRIAVDHHQTRDELADHYVVDERAAAAALLLFEWAIESGWSLDAGAKDGLFIGIATDTGWFAFSNTDTRVFQAAGALSAAGVSPNRLWQMLYQHERAQRILLKGAAMHSLELHADDRLAVMVISLEAMARVGADPADTENLINEPLAIASVRASVLLLESEGGVIRVSFRSKPPDGNAPQELDVAVIAQQFGGGGHARASGARLQLPLAEARTRVVHAMLAALPAR